MPAWALEDAWFSGLTFEEQQAVFPHLVRLDPADSFDAGAYRAGARFGITSAAVDALRAFESDEERAEREAFERSWAEGQAARKAQHQECSEPCGRHCDAHWECSSRCGPGCLIV